VTDAKTVLWTVRWACSSGTFAAATRHPSPSGGRDRAFTVVGGGDSAPAIPSSDSPIQVAHVSTGGGGTLEFIEQAISRLGGAACCAEPKNDERNGCREMTTSGSPSSRATGRCTTTSVAIQVVQSSRTDSRRTDFDSRRRGRVPTVHRSAHASDPVRRQARDRIGAQTGTSRSRRRVHRRGEPAGAGEARRRIRHIGHSDGRQLFGETTSDW